MKLFDIALEYRQAADALSDLSLPDDVVRDTLESISGDITTKVTNIVMLAHDWTGDLAKIKKHEEAVIERRKALEKRIASLKQYVLDGMQFAGITEIKSPELVIRVTPNPPAVTIEDERQVPAEYWVAPPPPQVVISKSAIKAAIDAGIEVPGAKITRSVRLVIR
jgi:hypothetical protein